MAFLAQGSRPKWSMIQFSQSTCPPGTVGIGPYRVGAVGTPVGWPGPRQLRYIPVSTPTAAWKMQVVEVVQAWLMIIPGVFRAPMRAEAQGLP